MHVFLPIWNIEEIGNVCDPSNSPTTPKPTPSTPKPTKPPKVCTGSCGNKDYANDKFCDDDNNNCGCKWDGGGCCGLEVEYDFCQECKCKDPNSKFKGQVKGKA